MTLALLPIAAALTLTLGTPPRELPSSNDAAPEELRIHTEVVECVTLWRGRHRRTYCRVLRSGPTARRRPAAANPPIPGPPTGPPPAPRSPLPPPAPPPPPHGPSPAAFLTTAEAQVMRLLNQLRRSKGLGALALDKTATRVARAHSRDMCRRRYFAHRNPDGKMPWDRLKAGGVRFRAAGENIAAGQRSAREVHQDWNRSPGHRRNRLQKGYRRMGIGVYRCAGVPYWTEVFMR